MTTTLKRISTSTALTLSAGFAAEVLGYRAFHQLVRQDVEALLGGVKVAEPTIVTAEMLDGLPVPVRRYLTYSGVMGKPIPRTVHLRQAGRMQLNSALPWVRLAAEEHYSIDPPGFVWETAPRYLGPIPHRFEPVTGTSAATAACSSRSPRSLASRMQQVRRSTRPR